jgi:gluconokinase
MSGPLRLVVMGVSGCGKSHIGARLAERLDAVFLDGDDYHPAENVAKMAAGRPLNDADRGPWLDRLAQELASRGRVVLACSALRRRYRDVLRSAEGTRFVFLDGGAELIRSRVEARTGHFMPAGLLRSQFDALERPGDDEPDVHRVAVDAAPERVVEQALCALGVSC